MRPLPRHALALSCLLLGLAVQPMLAQEVKQRPPGEAAPKTEPEVFDLVVSRAELPVPAFRYRLLPEVGELNPGDAAPIYLRLPHEIGGDRIEALNKHFIAWQDLPLAQLPVKEAGAVVQDWAGKIRQIEFGTRRESCRWDYTIREEADHAFEILLPDAQGMRTWARLLALKARVEIASGQLEQAIGTIKTGIAFGRHVAMGPFYINKLIGAAIVYSMLERVNEVITQPGAPNLSWALTALPRPLVGMREATEVERLCISTVLAGQPLTNFDPTKARTDAEWTALLVDLHARMARINSAPSLFGAEPVPLADLEGYRRAMLSSGREYLKRRGVEAKTDDQALVLAILGLYREFLDERTTRAYLPFAEAEQMATVDEAARKREAAAGPAAVFYQLLPTTEATRKVEVALDRKVAILRVVEALRLYAARHDGQWPDRLDQIREIPIPLDPVNGMPFEYRRDGATATLTGPTIPGRHRLAYNLTLRP